VSAVFNTYAPPIYETEEECERLIEKAIDLSKINKVQYLEIKCINKLSENIVNKFNLIKKMPYSITTLELDKYDTIFSIKPLLLTVYSNYIYLQINLLIILSVVVSIKYSRILNLVQIITILWIPTIIIIITDVLFTLQNKEIIDLILPFYN